MAMNLQQGFWEISFARVGRNYFAAEQVLVQSGAQDFLALA
jgi:hypothetical protein